MTENRRALVAVLVGVIALIVLGQVGIMPANFVLAPLLGVLVWVMTAPRGKGRRPGVTE